MRPAPDIAALVGLLDWYRAAGADACVESTAIDWLARGDRAPGHGFAVARLAEAAEIPGEAPVAARAAPQPPPAARRPTPPPVAPVRQFPTAQPEQAVTAAREAAREAPTLDALRATLAAFDGCALKATAKNLCFYRGAARARLMIVGEAPGRDEDLEGKPFVGPAGKLLDRMLAAIALTEADVHITNIVYWRPPGNRTPTPQEAQVCRPFLERQVELVQPEIVLLLGGAAAKHVLDVADGIMRVRGKWRDQTIGRHGVRTLATLHPAYLLRSPADKRKAWRDLLAVKAALAGDPPRQA